MKEEKLVEDEFSWQSTMAKNYREEHGKKKTKIALYIRVSTQEQALEGHSIAAQEANGREFAERMGYEVAKVYADEGVSGKSTKHRAAFQQMMSDAKSEEKMFQIVVVWKLTRLARNMLDTLKTVDKLLKLDIGLYSISESFDITTSSGKLMLQLLGSFAEFERNQISENVSMAMMNLAATQHRYCGGRRLGYVSGIDDNGRKQLIVEPDEAKTVQLIFAKYLGGEGYRAIANHLNRHGYKTLKGNSFSTTAVKDILHNKIYGGYIEYARYQQWDSKRRKGKNPNPILVKGEHQPIIDEETYKTVQDRLALETKKPKWNHTGENVLTGLLRCPECGAPMAASNVTNTLKDGTKKRIRYYSCGVFRSKGRYICHANSIRADKAEAFVAARLKEIVQVPEILASLVKQTNQELREQITPLEQELAVIASEKLELTPKLKRLEGALVDSPELYDNLIDRIKDLQAKIALHTQRENEILSILSRKDRKIEVENVQQITASLDRLLEHSEKKVVKEIYRTFIDKITFDKLNKEDIKIYMKFDETIIQQLNDIYNEVVSDDSDAASFVLERPFYSTI